MFSRRFHLKKSVKYRAKVKIRLMYVRECRRRLANLTALMVVIVFLPGLVAPFDLDPLASFKFKNVRLPKRLNKPPILPRIKAVYKPGSLYSLVRSILLVDIII